MGCPRLNPLRALEGDLPQLPLVMREFCATRTKKKKKARLFLTGFSILISFQA